jgi:hypothetical protein
MKGIIKKIFNDHWDAFENKYGDRIRPSVKKEIKKMLKCMDISNGYIEYKCRCGESKKVGFSCKSRLCNSCGKVKIDKWVENVTEDMLNVSHRHMVFTIPEELRDVFLEKRHLLRILSDIAAEVVMTYYKTRSKKEEYVPGIITVIHTFGRDLKWNPHVHMLVTEGGIGNSGTWKDNNYIHYAMMRNSWMYLLLSRIKQEYSQDLKVKRILSKLWKEKDKGLYVYGEGRMTTAHGAARYIGRYMGRPAIAEYRITSYDGKMVKFWYERHEDGQHVEEEIPVYEFIKKVIRHIPEEQFKQVRYYGLYSRRKKGLVKKLLSFTEKVKKLTVKKLRWRERLMKAFGNDPLKCKHCGREMIMEDIYYPKYGSMKKFYEKRMLASVEKELNELKQIHQGICVYFGGDDVPVYR